MDLSADVQGGISGRHAKLDEEDDSKNVNEKRAYKVHQVEKHRRLEARCERKKNGRGAITLTCVCEHSKLFSVEVFLERWSALTMVNRKKKTDIA